MNTLTSSSSLLREIPFSRASPLKIKKNSPPSASPLDSLPEDPLFKELEKIAHLEPLEGKILFKGEWIGYGPSLPPRSLEGRRKEGGERREEGGRREEEEGEGRREEGGGREEGRRREEDGGRKEEEGGRREKGLLDYERLKMNIGESGFHVDVNDPRNEWIVEDLRTMRNRELRELLKKEEMLPFYELESLRQKLLKLRFSNPDIMEQIIPIGEEDIAKNVKLIELLEENERENKALEDMKVKLNNNSKLYMDNLKDFDHTFPQNEQTIERIIKAKKILM